MVQTTALARKREIIPQTVHDREGARDGVLSRLSCREDRIGRCTEARLTSLFPAKEATAIPNTLASAIADLLAFSAVILTRCL